MPQIEEILGGKVFVEIGDGGDPETWSHPILINTTKSLSSSASTVDWTKANPDDWTAPVAQRRNKDVIDTTIAGEGVCDAASVETFRAYLKQKAPLRIRFRLVGEQGGGAAEVGNFHLTEFALTSDNLKGPVSASVSFAADGDVSPEA